ncbi:hypothetical protein HK103_002386 [Boothiomyces macroporosus]|uniref:P-loop containing nucleoside triphosphate hydrolase protein n=1 Tax=Boothiomyces macroporosus TaxID=261099 RepID=A0AAD5U9N8_9FUNG|nr:hypothetical protein HK103_002386 [Boothiomyces macroporosus]
MQSLDTSNDAIYFISIYALIGISVVLASDLESIVTYIGAYKASLSLHSKLLHRVLQAPLRFFETTPVGRILNRFSKDLDFIDSAVMDMLHFFLDRLFNTIIIIIVVGTISPAFLLAIPPIAVAFVLITQKYLRTSRELKRLESVTTSPTYAQFSETLNGTSTIRAYGAEERFSSMIRKKVDDNHKPYYHVWAANRWLCLRTDMMSTFIILAAGLAVVLSDIPAGWAAMCITYALEFSRSLLLCVRLQAEVEMAMNSVERVEEYCKIEQEPPAIVEGNRPDPNWPSKGAVQVKGLCVKYAPALPNVLNGVSFNIKPREKVAVVGRTGAGKSTLSLAFFRIIPLSGGSITIDGIDISSIGLYDLRSRLTIIPQDPVLFTGTLRSNLDPLEQNDDQTLWEALKRVHFLESMQSTSNEGLFVSQETLETEVLDSSVTLDYAVTENGGNFSQGQRQLLCLARSLIQRNKVIFLDEATASVDNETDAKIQTTIRSEFADSTIICIAHRLRTVIDYDKVLVLDKGQVLEIEESEVSVITAAGNGTTLVEDEEKATGAVEFDIYYAYFKATGGTKMFVVFLAAFLFYVGLKVFNDWWLKHWTDSNLCHTDMNTIQKLVYSTDILTFQTAYTIPDQMQSLDTSNDAIYFISIYALIGISVVLASDLESIVTYIGAYKASLSLHSKLLHRVLQAPLRFFETTPVGRILNRFSKDLDFIDSAVMDMLHFFLDRLFNTIIIIIVVGTISPAFLLAIPPIAVAFVLITQKYLRTSRELKRLESVTTSPTYAQFSETLNGTSTIRAYGAEERFSSMIRKKVDDNHKPYYHVWAANRWLCLRTDMMSTFIILAAGLAVVLSDIPAGWAAMCITYALEFSRSLLLCVRLQAEVEMAMNSVERVEEYCKIEQEPPAIVEGNRPDPNWPSKGAVQVKGLCVKYAPALPNVLNGVSFNIKPREKVAVVGRTGAGKSTLSLAFFRIIPLSGGSITIDGIDISSIGLYDLRSRLTIIPQDPVLFTGTLRSNLDPLEQNDDQTLWEALKRVHFLESMQSTSNEGLFVSQETLETEVLDSSVTLDYAVTENGGNFSQGQRQLLCLARSLIQRNKVIFLDEATASVDNETDAKIQTTIRSEFADSTIICIAHRLRTVIDYDKVLVLDKGQVLEYGSPLDLIQDSKVGVFRSMCEETGEFEELLEMAKDAQASRRHSGP